MGVYQRPDSKYWWMWLEGTKKRQRTAFVIGATSAERKESKASALEAYHSAMLTIGREKHQLPIEKEVRTFRVYAAWYDTHVVSHHRGAIREREILKGLIAHFADTPLTDITLESVIEWRTLRAQKASASTSNRELAVLKHMLKSAVPQYLDASPIAGLKMLRPLRRETHVLTPSEERRLLSKLDPPDQAMIICALDTLMRLSDVVNLRRDQDRGKYLVVEDPKVAPYKVPVSTRLRKALDGLKHPSPYYFNHRRQAKNPRDFRGNLKAMLRRACKAAHIRYGRKKGGLTFHALRHTGTTRLVEAGVPLPLVRELGGWKSLKMLERYTHPTETAKRAAVEKIGAHSRPTHGTAGKRSKVA